jgi:hypothetical protein
VRGKNLILKLFASRKSSLIISPVYSTYANRIVLKTEEK